MKKSISYYQLLKDIQTSVACSLFVLAASPAVLAQDGEDEETVSEETIVFGVRQSIQDAISMKRNASQIVDAISAEDIGKLPDDNIAEALQRVTGISIQRDELGEGRGFQIRGLSGVQVTIDGQALASDTFDDRVNSFSALDSSLVKAIEVQKTSRADQLEGGVGGTIALIKRKPFDFDEQTVQAKLELNDNSLESDLGYEFGAFSTKTWDLSNGGRIGILANISRSEKNQVTESFNANWDGIDLRQVDLLLKGLTAPDRELMQQNDHPGHPTFFMNNAAISRKFFETENTTADFTIQWQANEDLMFYLDGRRSVKDQWRSESKLTTHFVGTGNNNNGNKVHLIPGRVDLQTFSYGPSGNEYTNATLPVNVNLLPETNPRDIRAWLAAENLAAVNPNAVLNRSFVTAAEFHNRETRSNQRSPINPNSGLRNEEIIQNGFALGTEWQINETMLLDVKISRSTADRTVATWTSALDFEYSTPEIDLFYPSPFYDLNQGTDIPTIGYQLLDPEDFNNEITSLNIDLVDAANRNAVHRVRNLDRDIEPMEITTEEFTADLDWDVELGPITKISFGVRWNKENKFKDFYELSTPLVPNSFVDDDRDGIPDDRNGDGVLNNQDFQFRPTNPQATIEQIINKTDGVGGDRNAHSTLTPELADQWFELKNSISGSVSGNFPRQYWGTTDDPAVWDEFIAAVYGGFALVEDPTRHEEITEETTAAYFMLDFEHEVLGRALTGNFGVRYFTTDVNSEAYLSRNFVPWDLGELGRLTKDITVEEGGEMVTRTVELNGAEYSERYQDLYQSGTYPLGPNFTVETRGENLTGTFGLVGKDYTWFETSYDYFLPSLNLAYELNDDHMLRLALSRTISRPETNDIIIDPARLGPDDFRRGNPELEPAESDNFDISYEWYINDSDALSVAYFAKDRDGTITFLTSFNEILDGYMRIPQNGGSESLDGFEIAYTGFFDFLPEHLQGFGVQLNYTATDSEQDTGINDFGGSSLPALRLSDSSYNIILFYENHGFSVRAAYNWRDRFLQNVGRNYIDADEPYGQGTFEIDNELSSAIGQTAYVRSSVAPNRWVLSRGQLDVSIDYRFNDMFKVFFQGNNITEEANEVVLDSKTAIKSFNVPSTFYRLGVQYKF